ncbi:hypothetical protein Asppvi_007040 [Aspergillus pseudoviridinutans]|uniref:NAD(P)-binding protein n=1 Tax=Aspergillus pseudoviridinutans TaxID=1517512 RepID=A0A9P3BFF5_9EURO|nr:uncharacterized protein Asppvi_007040 [Aspergillus pseudoviridinutans]GIJ88123.1 hypothetical protein Asppvi_007040 [Aspergillus pseudoviridinutans]
MAFLIPEPLRMILTNPAILDFSSDGPVPYALRQKITGRPPPLPVGLSLISKAVLVTGATGGIGLEAARQLAALGPRSLILGVRNIPKAERLKVQLEREHPSVRVVILELNQESLASVDTFVDELYSNETHLDIAILNAGGLVRESRLTVDGYSPTLQVNFISTAYLSLRLLPILRTAHSERDSPSPSIECSSSGGRLVLVGSEGHAWTTYITNPTDACLLSSCRQAPSPSTSEEQYYRSKLFLSLIGRELGRRLDRREVTVITTTPGFCASNFFSDQAGLLTRLIKRTTARSVQQGGALHVHAATTDGRDIHGGYLRDGKPTLLSKFAQGSEGELLQQQLWEELQTLLRQRGYEICI